MNLFESDIIALDYQEENKLLISSWKTCENTEEFIAGIKGCKEACDKVQVHNALWHFNDFNFIVPPDLQQWKDDFLNRGVIQKAGVFKKLAFVVGKDVLALLSGMDPIENSKGVITPHCFTNEKHALAYIGDVKKQEDTLQSLNLPKLSVQKNEGQPGRSQILIDVNSDEINEYLFFLNKLLKSKSFRFKHVSKFLLLTKSEKEILNLILAGHTNDYIARYRHVAYETIKTHRKNILRKLECRNIRELAKYGIFFSAMDLLY